jgi:hypothetical protein
VLSDTFEDAFRHWRRAFRPAANAETVDGHVQVLKVALPYHESHHVLGIAYNILCGGTSLQDIERRR